ncbi:MAG: toll/interleukin-1 receptor domain-containing protein [Planctomycetota bacterium]
MIPPNEVFLSHSSADRQVADSVAKTVRAHGVPVWYSPTNINTAQQWHDEIGRALERCDWFVLLLSPSSVGSRWVKHEFMFALREARYDERITSVIVEECDHKALSWTLGAYQMESFVSHGREKSYRGIFKAWGLGFDPGKVS